MLSPSIFSHRLLYFADQSNDYYGAGRELGLNRVFQEAFLMFWQMALAARLAGGSAELGMKALRY